MLDLPVAEVRPMTKYQAITTSDGYYYIAQRALEDICWELDFLPTIASKDKVKIIIRDLIATLRCGAVDKVYAIGLDLIADMSIDMIDKYFMIKSLFIEAQYNLELAHFYEELSIQCKEETREGHPGTILFGYAINYITYADIAVLFVKDREQQNSISHYLKNARQILYSEFTKDVRRLSNNFWMQYENLSEVLTEIYVKDYALAELIDDYFIMAGAALERSEIEFGIKNEKQFIYYLYNGTRIDPTKRLIDMIHERTKSPWLPPCMSQRVRTGAPDKK